MHIQKHALNIPLMRKTFFLQQHGGDNASLIMENH